MKSLPGVAFACWIAARSEQAPCAVRHNPSAGVRSGLSDAVFTSNVDAATGTEQLRTKARRMWRIEALQDRVGEGCQQKLPMARKRTPDEATSPSSVRRGLLAVRRLLRQAVGMRFEPHRIEDGEAAGEAESQDPAEILHGNVSRSIHRVGMANVFERDASAQRSIHTARVADHQRQEERRHEQHEAARDVAERGDPTGEAG